MNAPVRRSIQPVSEREFQDHVLTVAGLAGFHGLHIRASHGALEGLHSLNRPFPRGAGHDDSIGFPDLLLVHPGRGLLVLAELKRSGKKPTAEQLRWLAWLDQVGDVRIGWWTPRDEQDMQRVLRGEP